MMFEELKKGFLEEKVLFSGLCLLGLTGIVTRFVFIDKFPPGLSHDELDLILSVKTYFLYGKDASGVSFPAATIVTRLESATTGLPSLLLSVFLGPFDMSIGRIRFIYSFLNILTGFFIAKLLLSFTKDIKVGFIAFVLFLINPWSFFYTRMALAAPFSLLFLVVGLYSLFTRKGWGVGYSFLFFLLSAFSYLGALPVVPLLLVPIVLLQAKNVGKNQLKINITFIALTFIILGGFLFISKATASSTINRRASEISFLSLEEYSSRVNDKRRQSISYPGKDVFINKATEFLDASLERYLGSYSTGFLFLSGDTRAAYNFGEHGMFYYLDFVFIVLGIVGIYVYGKKAVLPTAALVFIGPTGSVLSIIDRSYVFRSFSLLLGLIILITFGLVFLYEKLPRAAKNTAILFVLVFYLISFIQFLSFFFFEYPIKEAENHYLSERVLVNYLMREERGVYVVVENPSQIFRQYVFYTERIKLLGENGYSGQRFEVDNLVITNKCPEEKISSVVVSQPSIDCQGDGEIALIQNQKDAGTVYKIYNSSLCKATDLRPWRRNHKLADYQIEKLKRDEFCNRWLAVPLQT